MSAVPPWQIPRPAWVPEDLAGWFPDGMLLGTVRAGAFVGLAACSQCGAGVPVYRPDDDRHLRRHVEWHRVLANSAEVTL